MQTASANYLKFLTRVHAEGNMAGLKKFIITILLFTFLLIGLPPGTGAADNECGDGIFSTACATFKSLETLEVSPPERFLYSIIDGGTGVQQFTQIRANIRSLYGGLALGSGQLQAVATYRRRINYEPDLSNDPPTASDRETTITTSYAAPIAVATISASEKTEFVFSFNSAPIPAGITDLRFAVIYEGTTDGISPAFAYGTKDLNEPHHLLMVNSTDRVYLDHVLRTAAYVRANNLFWPYEGSLDPYSDVGIRLKVYLDWNDDLANAYYQDEMSFAEYSRIIFLADEPEFTILAQFGSPTRYNGAYSSWDPPIIQGRYISAPGVVNQGSNDSFENTQIEVFRGKRAHTIVEFVEYYPDNSGVKTVEWPYELYEPSIPVNVWP